MHGPDEVAFACRTYELVEDIPASFKYSKIGYNGRGTWTLVNLSECIRAAKSRVVFINTGF